jgi:hypothetical protein
VGRRIMATHGRRCWLIVYASHAHFVEVVHVLRTEIRFFGFDRHQLDNARELERQFVGWRYRRAPVLAHIECVAKREETH